MRWFFPFVPYSKEAFVQTYVIQIAPEHGGLVNEVFVKANLPVKKGEPLFQMDPAPWQYKVDQYAAQLSAADTMVAELAQQVDEAEAQVARITVNLALEQTKYAQIAEAAAQNPATGHSAGSPGR